MRTFTPYFLIFLAILPAFPAKTSRISFKETLTDDELIDFPIAELEDDCENLQFFNEILQSRINQKENHVNRMNSAILTIEDSKILILKIINIEKKLELSEFSEKSSRKLAKSSRNFFSKKTFLQMRDDFNKVIEKLDDVYELLSAQYQENIERLDYLLEEMQNEHTQNIQKCREIIKLLNDIAETLSEAVENTKNLLEKLNEKAQDTNLMMIYSDC